MNNFRTEVTVLTEVLLQMIILLFQYQKVFHLPG